MDKANVFRSMAFFRKIFDERAVAHPRIAAEHRYIDATALDLVRKPWEFDVMVTENMFGDILSDETAALVGGMGMAPSGDIGDDHALFQPCHGSAPDIAGQGMANPTATILSAAMMLDWLAERSGIEAVADAGARLTRAVDEIYASNRSGRTSSPAATGPRRLRRRWRPTYEPSHAPRRRHRGRLLQPVPRGGMARDRGRAGGGMVRYEPRARASGGRMPLACLRSATRTRCWREAKPDLADIVTPPATHLALVELAASHGVPIICQKALAPSYDEAEAIVRAAEKARVPLAVHENFRWQPWYREAKRLLDAGTIGTPHSIAFRLRPGDGQGPRAYLDRQPYFQRMPRFLVYETAIHWIDTFRFLMGDVRAVTARLRRVNPAIDGEDAGYLIFEFANGATGLFDGNRANDHVAANPRRTMGEMWLEGSAGVLRMDGDARLWWKAHHGDEVAASLRPRRRRAVRRRLRHGAATPRRRASFGRRTARERRTRVSREHRHSGCVLSIARIGPAHRAVKLGTAHFTKEERNHESTSCNEDRRCRSWRSRYRPPTA